MGICAGEAIGVESEALGRASWGVGCGDMHKAVSEGICQRGCVRGVCIRNVGREV